MEITDNNIEQRRFNLGLLNFLNFTVLLSIISQIQDLSFGGSLRLFVYVAWIGLAFLSLIKINFRLPVNPFSIIFARNYWLIILFLLIATLFGYPHIQAGILLPLTVSLGTYFIGILLYQANLSIKNVSTFLKIYVIGTLILSFQIQLTYFPSIANWLGQMTYAYPAKNGAGQILALSILLLLFYFDSNKKMLNVLRYMLVTYLFFVMLMMQSRTSILGLSIIIATVIFFNSKKKLLYVSGLTFITIISFINENLMSIIRKSFFIDKYAGTDINTFSSGRIDLWIEAINEFLAAPILGRGIYYVDNFYLNILAEVGLIGFLLIIPIIVRRFYRNFKFHYNDDINRQKKKLYFIIKLFTVFYIFVSFLEAIPPLGPGVISFLFWLLSGYLDSDYQKSNTNIKSFEH